MAKRTKRRVKQRSRAHQRHLSKKRKPKQRARRKVGFGARKRRAKKTSGK